MVLAALEIYKALVANEDAHNLAVQLQLVVARWHDNDGGDTSPRTHTPNDAPPLMRRSPLLLVTSSDNVAKYRATLALLLTTMRAYTCTDDRDDTQLLWLLDTIERQLESCNS